MAHLPVTPEHIYGVLSMMVWSLVIVISIKYLLVVLRADNNGEGGIIALVARLDPAKERAGLSHAILIALRIFGASLLYGDGTITPAISVLSAVEGIQVATSGLDRFIVPIALAILIALFSFQRFGTAHIGRVFGPAMIVWFICLAVLGLRGILLQPHILVAFSPHWAIGFLFAEPLTAFLVLGTVFLVVTGGEAMYADLGNFGAPPIRRAWFLIVFPALLLNYFGQGALVLSDSVEIQHPFFHLAPGWATIPLVIVATIATVIASQAVISGVFSLTRQAIQLDLLPRMNVVQTNKEEFRQIYIPAVNWAMMIATCGLVLFFKSSGALSSAYGLAIAADMVITSILVFWVLRSEGWSRWLIGGMALLFLPLDLAFLIANAMKFFEGGWYPTLVGLAIFVLITTWRSGRRELRRKTDSLESSAPQFAEWMEANEIVRTKGTAIFLTSKETGIPAIMRHHVERNGALHELVLLVQVDILNVPFADRKERVSGRQVAPTIWRIDLDYGFADRINVPRDLRTACEEHGLGCDLSDATYYLGRETLLPQGTSELARWRAVLFGRMVRNAGRATEFFRIPRGRVVEIGMQIAL